ncbi:MAG: acetyltransferase [Myxococcales bacterium]|nr:acetyltransferase [Myxococcales bacterium]
MSARYVYGASGHGKVVADICRAMGGLPDGFIDDGAAVGSLVFELSVLGGGDWLAEQAGAASGGAASIEVALGIGDNAVRARIAARLRDMGVSLLTAIHPSAVVAPSARVGAGTVVMAGALINPDSVIGEGAIINTGVAVEHDNHIGDYAHLSANAATGGNVTIGAFAHLGLGATVLPGRRVGARSVVGAGAAVIRDLADDVVAVGVPARVIRGGS